MFRANARQKLFSKLVFIVDFELKMILIWINRPNIIYLFTLHAIDTDSNIDMYLNRFLTLLTNVKNYFLHDSVYLSKTVSKTTGIKSLTNVIQTKLIFGRFGT